MGNSTHVTVNMVVTDIVGSTALAERLGPDRNDDVRRSHFHTLRVAMASTDGTEIKHLGDGLMMSFPSTRAALDGAVALQRAVDAAGRMGGDPIAIRVGVATGDATLEDDEYFGVPVVQAVRLCALARPRQILASELVRMMTDRTDHVLTPVGALELKGLKGHTETFDVAWRVEEIGHGIPLPPAVARPARWRFVARDRELALLDEQLAEAHGGRRRLTLVFGEAGLGKTTLLSQWIRGRSSSGLIVLYGRCDEEVPQPFQPFMEALDHLVAHAPEPLLHEHIARHGGVLLGRLPSAAAGVATATAALDRVGDGDADRDALFVASTELIGAACGIAPVVLVLDDLHWADRDTLLLLRHLTLRSGAMRLLVIGTVRDDEVAASAVGDLAPAMYREQGVARIDLEPLDVDATLQLMEAAAGHEVGADAGAVAQVITKEAGGNPFFTVELIRHLSEIGAVIQDEAGRWTASGEPITLPANVRDVIWRRVSRLGQETSRVLSAAAVLGREMDPAVLATIADTTHAAVLDVLEEAAAARLVHETSTRPGWFSYSHAIVQHTLYSGLSRARRLVLHRRAAEAIEASGSPDRVAELAHHWGIAAAGDPDARPRAVQTAIDAGRAASEELAPDGACRWFEQALALGGNDIGDAERGRLLLRLGECQRQAGRPDFRETLLAASRIGSEIGDDDLLVESALANNRGIQSTNTGTDRERLELLRAALHAVGHDDARRRPELLALTALELLYDAPYGERLALVTEAIETARSSGDERTLLRVLNLAHNAIKSPDSLVLRLESTAEAVLLSRRAGEPADRYWALDHRIRALAEVGELAEVDRCLDESGAIVGRLVRPVMTYLHAMHRSWRSILAADLPSAERWAEQMRQVGTESSQPEADAMYGALLAQIRTDQGRAAELVDLFAAIAEARPATNAIRAALANLLAQTGAVDRASSLLREQREVGFESIHHDNLWSSALAEWAGAAALVGDREAAAALLPLLAPFAGLVVHNGATTAGPVDRICGLLLRTLGQEGAALGSFHDSIELCRKAEMPTYLAYSLIDAATVRAGAEAEVLLTEALEIAAQHDLSYAASLARAARTP